MTETEKEGRCVTDRQKKRANVRERDRDRKRVHRLVYLRERGE